MRVAPGRSASVPATLRPERRRPFAVAPLLRALRPKQWTKNALLLAAPGAAGELLHPSVLSRALIGVASFAAISSAGYLMNDLLDAGADRAHPLRRLRPIASGALPVRSASVTASILLVTGAALGVPLGWRFLVVLGAYVLLAASYSLGLKRIAVIDIVMVAGCYVCRAVAGSAACSVPLSQWFLILVSFGALFVVAGKRYANLLLLDPSSAATRSPLEGYTPGYLRFVWMCASAVAIAAYCLWAFAQPNVRDSVPWSELSTIPFVTAMLRYALLLETGRGGAPEDVLIGDRPLQLLGLLWVSVYACGVYLGR